MRTSNEIPKNSSPQFSFSLISPTKIFKFLWQKISSLASKIFTAFTNCCNFKDFFSTREITLLRDARTIPKPLNPPDLKDKTVSVVILPKPSQILLDEFSLPPEPVYNEYDASLEGLRSFIREFSVLGVDILYETHIVENMESFQNLAPSVPPVIKSVAKIVVEMGDKAVKPLFKRFAEQKASTIDPALQKIFKILLKPDPNILREKLIKYLNECLVDISFKEGVSASDYINLILTYFSSQEGQRKCLAELCVKNHLIDPKLISELFEKAEIFCSDYQNNQEAELYNCLETQLSQEFAETKISSKENLESHYIHPILDWLLLSNHNSPLTDLFGKLDAEKEGIIDKIFERAITVLVERKIDQYSHILERTLQRRLGEIIHQTIQKNASRIADFFSDRICELISSMSFTETFDHLIHETFHQHILGIIEAENAQEEHKQLLEKSIANAKIVPTNEKSLDAQIRAQNHLNSVEKHGGKEAFLRHELLKTFSKLPACSPHVQQIIEQEINLILQGKDPTTFKRASGKALYSAIADDLLNLMTPIRKKINDLGEVEEVDPFLELWNRIYLPEEFYHLVIHSEELTQEFATPQMTVLFEKIKTPIIEVLKNLFKSTTKDLLKKQLIDVVQTAFEKITIPEKVNEICAQSVFPIINTMLIGVFAKQELGRNLKEFIPLFHQLIHSTGPARNNHIRTIQHALIKLAKNKFHHFNPAEFYKEEEEKEGITELKLSGLTTMDWLNITHPIVLELEQGIIQSQSNNNTSSLSESDISLILKNNFQATVSKINNPAFGEMASNILFKIGKLQKEMLIGSYVKSSLSSLIASVIQPWRKSYQNLVETISGSLKTTYLKPSTVKALFFDNTVTPTEVTDKKLAHQIHMTSCLSYDILTGIIQSQGSIINFAAKKFIPNHPDEINRVITMIYKKLFGNQLINQNLTILAYEKIFHSLAMAAETVRMKENIRAHHLASNF